MGQQLQQQQPLHLQQQHQQQSGSPLAARTFLVMASRVPLLNPTAGSVFLLLSVCLPRAQYWL
jgi:hypothetical protein